MKSVLLDSSFVIRLLKPDDEFHRNVVGYFRHFAECGIDMCLSTIVVSEYAVVDDPDVLRGMGVFRILDFDYRDAARSGAFSAFLKRRESRVETGTRAVVINDIKLLAQAANRGLDAFITKDRKMLSRMVEPLRSAGHLNFRYMDLSVPPEQALERHGDN